MSALLQLPSALHCLLLDMLSVWFPFSGPTNTNSWNTGPMIWAPLSEVPFIGRCPVYVLTLFVFVVFQLAVAIPENFGMLMVSQFFATFFERRLTLRPASGVPFLNRLHRLSSPSDWWSLHVRHLASEQTVLCYRDLGSLRYMRSNARPAGRRLRS